MRERLLCTSMSYTHTVQRLLPFPEIAVDDRVPTEVDSFIWYRHYSLRGSYDSPSFQRAEMSQLQYHYNTEGRLTRQPNLSDYRKVESLRGADLRRFLDSNTLRSCLRIY